MTERFEGEGVLAYDQRIPLLVPGYELLHQLSAAQLMTRLGDEARVLLVGVGTGSELLLLGRLCPGWRFVAQDISADMLAQARQRADEAGMGDRISWLLGELPTASLHCDAALCLLVLHFLDETTKSALLTHISRQLEAGSPLLLADLMTAADPVERTVMGQQARLGGLPVVASDRMVQRLADDFIPLDEGQLQELLQEAGFSAGQRYFQALGFHGWLATRR
ncbi:class I SAM-dependent methyltransferase [Aeromonas lusitana]|uniref:Class I SAM-dependent methyltransferase n=1 Tax=Aeromonas lusitana TaxID=931529 RepID=A0A2M8HEW0_9GAMM|nr:class I SAM-dependent methyltransferase [Aeromonas lusitana]PJC95089.1 class I SAM-dependent methyltransferase [Aeromonas lusitana]